MARSAQKNEWAINFSNKMHSWLTERDMSGRQFANLLGIPVSRWSDAYSGNAITDTEYYARIFCYTQLTAADPRTVPARKSGPDGWIPRAWSEEEWQTWYEQYGSSYTPDGNGAVTALPQAEPVEEASDEETVDVVTDSTNVQSQLQQTIALLEYYLSQDDVELQQFFKANMKPLRRLYQLVGVFTIESPASRRAAIVSLIQHSRRNPND